MDLEQYIEASMEGLRIQTGSHDNIWGISDTITWNVDQERASGHRARSPNGDVFRAH